MKVVLNGTCSECYQVTELVLTQKTKELVCPTCGHSVPPLDQGSMSALAKDQSKQFMMGVAAAVAFLLAGLLFLGFISKAGGGPPGGLQALPGPAMGMMVGSIVMLLVSLVLGFIASTRTYVCEF